MEQKAKLKKKELIYITYVNADETEVLRFTVYRAVRRSKREEHYLVVHRYINGLYAPDLRWKTLFYERRMVGYTIREAVQALRQAIQKYATDVVLESLIIDKDLQQRAGITFEEKLVERLEKIFTLFELDKDT